MTSRRRFRHADLCRAVKATKAAGVEISHIRIEPGGTILIVPGKPPTIDMDGIDGPDQDAAWLEKARRGLSNEIEQR